MITDGRYFFRAHSATQLWRYDRKWRRTKYFEPRNGAEFEVTEGVDLLLVQSGGIDNLHLSLHAIDDPAEPIAEAFFTDFVWTFKGDKAPWARVGEHVLVSLPPADDVLDVDEEETEDDTVPEADDDLIVTPQAEVQREVRRGLLRIADGAVVDELVDLPLPTTVVAVPESRLVVLAGSGAITVYDPQSQHAGVRLQLSHNNPHPMLRFRNNDSELWVDDVDSLLKLETRNWTVTDAAGSAVDEEGGETAPAICAWAFSPDLTRVLVVREGTNDVVIATADSMDPIATFVLARPAVDIAESEDGRLVAVDARGGLPRSKRMETFEPEGADSAAEPDEPA